jgi:hypothetical protein
MNEPLSLRGKDLELWENIFLFVVFVGNISFMYVFIRKLLRFL